MPRLVFARTLSTVPDNYLRQALYHTLDHKKRPAKPLLWIEHLIMNALIEFLSCKYQTYVARPDRVANSHINKRENVRRL